MGCLASNTQTSSPMMVTLGKRLESDAQMLCCASLSARVCRSLAPVCTEAKRFLLLVVLQSNKTFTHCQVSSENNIYSHLTGLLIPPFPQFQVLQCGAPSSRWRLPSLPQWRQKPPDAWGQQDSPTCLKNRDAFLQVETKIITENEHLHHLEWNFVVKVSETQSAVFTTHNGSLSVKLLNSACHSVIVYTRTYSTLMELLLSQCLNYGHRVAQACTS